MEIFTIGYEGAEIGAFLHTLEAAGVEHVLDVRDYPASRKRDFSKNILRRHLEARGIAYTHFKALGDPKEGRHAMRRGDKETFYRIFENHISSVKAREQLAQAINVAATETSALLCYERNPKDCHRRIIANRMVATGRFKCQDIGVQTIEKRVTRNFGTERPAAAF
jgi:uncharacterized protein (DUF488 family)